MIRMSTNREGETAVTIPLQYNEAVSSILFVCGIRNQRHYFINFQSLFSREFLKHCKVLALIIYY